MTQNGFCDIKISKTVLENFGFQNCERPLTELPQATFREPLWDIGLR